MENGQLLMWESKNILEKGNMEGFQQSNGIYHEWPDKDEQVQIASNLAWVTGIQRPWKWYTWII